MSPTDLDAIRARDRDYDDIFDEQARMPKDIAHRLVAWPVADRRALLAYVDELQAELAAERANATLLHEGLVKVEAENAALRRLLG